MPTTRKKNKASKKSETAPLQIPSIQVEKEQTVELEEPVEKQLYRNRYYAMFHVFGWSLVITLLWGMGRWLWLNSMMIPDINAPIPNFLVPLFLSALHLLLCRHYIRGVHDSIEWVVWGVQAILSYLLFCSVAIYVGAHYYPFLVDDDYPRQFAMLWQTILLLEAILLFLVYQRYYVVEEYEESAKRRLFPSVSGLIGRKLSNILIFVIVPAVMLLMYIAMKYYGVEHDISDGKLLVKGGSLFFPSVLEYGEWWRLITYGFQHGGIIHLASNLFCYYVCMISLVTRYNGYQLFSVFLLAVFGSGVFILIFSNGNTVGASGGVFGLMSFWLLDSYHQYKSLKKNAEDATVKKMRKVNLELISNIGGVLGYNVLRSFASGISLSGHLGGMIAGVGLWFLLNMWPILTWVITSMCVVLISVGLNYYRSTLMQIHMKSVTGRKEYISKKEMKKSWENLKWQMSKPTKKSNQWNSFSFRGKKNGQWYGVIVHVDPTYLNVPGLQQFVAKKLFDQNEKDVMKAIEKYVETFQDVDYNYKNFDYPYIEIDLTEPRKKTDKGYASIYADRTLVRGKNDYVYECSYEIKIDTATKRIIQ
jgi:membrane associated rhomboid family serine protease